MNANGIIANECINCFKQHFKPVLSKINDPFKTITIDIRESGNSYILSMTLNNFYFIDSAGKSTFDVYFSIGKNCKYTPIERPIVTTKNKEVELVNMSLFDVFNSIYTKNSDNKDFDINDTFNEFIKDCTNIISNKKRCRYCKYWQQDKNHAWDASCQNIQSEDFDGGLDPENTCEKFELRK